MLNLSLPRIARGPLRARWDVAPDEPWLLDTGLALLEPLQIELEARQMGEAVLVRGRLRTRADLACRRCLRPVPQAVDEPFELLFERLEAEEAADLGGEVYALPEGRELDVLEPLREQLLLSLPTHVVCDEACAGLCPQCGADRNQGSCDCEPVADHSAWDALRNIEFD